MKEIIIDGRTIGGQRPPYIVAELSANHNGSIERALDTIASAKSSGANAIKLQTYSPETMTINSESDEFIIRGGLWDGYTLYELYEKAQTPFVWHKELFGYARDIGITCFSTPFDETAVDLLEDLGSPAYKISSFEATDLPLIRYVASTKKPMIVSTGMANSDEIEELVQAARDGGCADIILLHCISSYPAPIDQLNLLTIPDLAKKFCVHVGLSDHTMNNTASIVATGLGAVLIEKHFTLDRSVAGPDSSFSIEPEELKSLVIDTTHAAQSLGLPHYKTMPAEAVNLKFRRSLYFVKNMKIGDVVKSDCIRRIRPGFGLEPKYFDAILGRKMNMDASIGTPVGWHHFL
jgi:N-acetylneuraminate synthase